MSLTSPTDADRPWAGRRLHFCAIGGASMSGLAVIAHRLGASVSGSDRAESTHLRDVRSAGIEPIVGEHAADHVPAGAEVVYSSAVDPDNPERVVARSEGGGGELHRAQLLAQITALKRLIAVSGTHGKTTTTSMITHILRACGADPAYMIGGELRSSGHNAEWGAGEWMVVEADESDRSLLHYRPAIAVLTNAELDHHATYRSRLDLEETLATFLGGAERAVVWDRPALRRLAARAGETIAYDAPAASLGPAGARFVWQGHTVTLAVPGQHNAVNAAGALWASTLAGIEPVAAVAALAHFSGARRRMERLGRTVSGAWVYDDYAHHPTELAAAIAAARTLAPARLVAVFQPHLFSRTRMLADGFGASLAGADLVAVTDIYPARECAGAFPGVDGRLVASAAADHGAGRTVLWLRAREELRGWLTSTLREGDLCLLMGAGDLDRLGRELVSPD
ncbi:UDP-N-acetylmuramate--L-alanine ligase [Conexibacter sp. DBS9H8]|uniref:UDP-N-acetylmuramate--L-alanine ligase n=1 Tax=Conexibacter sp. DBS9H8 TaxID=2937801 RepID=UPI00200D449D|nr:UDP-N-acetylmuramate--L-alanine ligase [Conexibacter sp. DBS9H8]